MLRVGITCGDPNGIGPEVVQKALKIVTVGTWRAMPLPSITPILFGFENIPARESGPTAASGAWSYAALEAATAAALKKEIDVLVTAPISKTAWKLAGITQFTGHTDYLEAKCGAHVRMGFLSDPLNVVLQTIHTPLLKTIHAINPDSIFESLRIIDGFWKQHLHARPRIAVCGYNPHAGEGGLMGDEEQRLIAPGIEKARTLGIQADGPFSPDTIFYQVVQKKSYDVVLAMYHDQGLIPVKTLAFDQAVNVTLGLPFVRTSPDHGTAYDIAGKDLADPSSMVEAIRWGVKLVRPSC